MNLAASLLLADKVHIYKDFCLASVGAVLKCNRNLYRSSEDPWGVAAKKHGLLSPHPLSLDSFLHGGVELPCVYTFSSS